MAMLRTEANSTYQAGADLKTAEYVREVLLLEMKIPHGEELERRRRELDFQFGWCQTNRAGLKLLRRY